MSSLAAQFLVALTLVARGAHAAVTCETDYTAKTGVDDKYCMMDAASCKTDSTCCTAPTPTKTCKSEASKITCDADTYNKRTLSTVGSDSSANKAQCCMKKATCATATCSAHLEKDTGKSDDVKCPGDATSCENSCCKDKAGLCWAWYQTAGNQCVDGTSMRSAWWSKMGSDKAACCGADVKCSTHACPATHEHKANAASFTCTDGTCDDSQCCLCKATTCCGTTVTCGTNMYKDSAKNGVTFTDKSTDCCSAQAQCKDSPTADTAASGAPVLSSFWPLFLAFSMLGLALRN